MRASVDSNRLARLGRLLASRWTIALAGLLTAMRELDPLAAALGLVSAAWMWFWLELRDGRRLAPMERPEFVAEWRRRLARGGERKHGWWGLGIALLRPDLRSEVGRAAASAGPSRLSMAAALVVLAARQVALLTIGHRVVAMIAPGSIEQAGLPRVALAVAAARLAIGLADRLITIPGRDSLRVMLVRATRFEFWPTWLVYLGLAPTFVRCSLRARHPLAFTACNPGIENGGGVVGESKLGIIAGLREGAVGARLDPALVNACCRTWPIETGPGPEPAPARAAQVDALVRAANPDLHFPVVLKPDVGQRGFSVRVVRSRREAEEYFRLVPGRVLVQPWHPGPGEVGIVWMRSRDGHEAGSIYSITLKVFPFLVGDGARTVEDLIFAHPRFRLQSATFLQRLAGRRLDVPALGERLPIALAGNHCQGTLFRDGAHLVTSELERAIGDLCRAFRGRAERDGLDAIRMDIRYRSEDDLRAGRLDPDSIIELNGTFGETTNIYDPEKPVSWSYRYLRGQWEALYALGRERMNAGGGGVRPVSVPAFVGMLIRNRRELRGSDLAD